MSELERLTNRIGDAVYPYPDSKGKVYDCGEDWCEKIDDSNGQLDCGDCHINHVLRKLSAYEDTGLSPEQVAEMKDRLDLAVSDMLAITNHAVRCPACKHFTGRSLTCGYSGLHGCTGFRWRGMKEGKFGD